MNDLFKKKNIEFKISSRAKHYDIVASKWTNKQLMTQEAIELLELKPNTFYNMVKDI